MSLKKLLELQLYSLLEDRLSVCSLHCNSKPPELRMYTVPCTMVGDDVRDDQVQ